jgi:hypothetical protein
MTISYSNLVFTSKGIGTFLKLLLKWKGSIYKMVWRELLIYMVLYASLSLVYRLALDDEGEKEQDFAVSTFYKNKYHYVANRNEISSLSFYFSKCILHFISWQTTINY